MIATTPTTKLIVSSYKLKRALSFIGGVIVANPIVPILEDVLCEIKDGFMQLTGSDLSTTISTKIEVESQSDVSVCVPYKLLYSLVSTLPEQPLTITIDSETLGVTLISDMGKYKVPGEHSIDFPRKPLSTKPIQTVAFDSEDRSLFAKYLTDSLFAVAAPNDSKEKMEGVCWWGTEIAATDGFRVARSMNVQEATDSPLLIPTKPAAIIAKFLSTLDEGVTAVIYPNAIQFSNSETSISALLASERFPDYQMAFPADNAIEWTMNRKALLNVLSRVSLMANKVTKLIGLEGDPTGFIKVWTRELTLSQECSETLKAEVNQAMKIGFNATYLAQALSHVEGEEVRFSMSHPGRPMLATGDDKNVVSLLAPATIEGIS